jgi:hypothetical protein
MLQLREQDKAKTTIESHHIDVNVDSYSGRRGRTLHTGRSKAGFVGNV